MNISKSYNRILFAGVYVFGFAVLFTATYVPGTISYDQQTTLSMFSYPMLAVWLVTFIFIFAVVNMNKRKLLLTDDLFFPGFVFFLILMIASSISKLESLRFALTPAIWHLLLAIIMMLVYNIAKPAPSKFLDYISGFIIFYGFLSLIVALIAVSVEMISIGPFSIIQHPDYPRLHGWYGNPNRLGPVLAVSSLSACYLWFRQHNVIYTILFVGFIFGTLLTGSRGTVIALLASLLVFLFMNKNKKIRGLINIKIFATISSLAILLYFTLLNLYQNLYDRADFEDSRLDIWLTFPDVIAVTNIYELLFGHGYGQFSSITGRSSHNSFISIFTEFGVIFFIGFFIYSLKITSYTIFYVSKRSNSVAAFIISSLIYLYMSSMFNLILFRVRFEGFLLVVIIVCSSIYRMNSKGTV